MQAWMMEDVPVSNDSSVVYHGRGTAVSSELSQGPHSSFPVVLLLPSLFFSSLVTIVLLHYKYRGDIFETQQCSTVLL